MPDASLKQKLDKWVELYNQPSFIENDPISIPHSFQQKEDIEIAAFLTTIIAWGSRPAIIKGAARMMKLMDNCPFSFVVSHSRNELQLFEKYVYRTFQGCDAVYFIKTLSHIYKNGGLEKLFTDFFSATQSIKDTLHLFHKYFFSFSPLHRTLKHLPDPLAGSAAKRMNLFLRWMVRKDDAGVDFGLWNFIPLPALKIPLDVHTSRTARELGLLKRKQNDWKAVEELTNNLLTFDCNDPVKYDFALFGASLNKDG